MLNPNHSLWLGLFLYFRPSMKTKLNIAIVGTGNLAWHLANAIDSSEHNLLQVLSRDQKRAEKFTQNLSAKGISRIDDIDANVEIIILALTDTALKGKYIAQFPKNAIMCHTSGSISMRVLKSHKKHGIFYPLQTFSKQKEVDFSNIPICLEASDNEVLQKLHVLANSLSKNIYEINSKQRKALHVAAVFACNFTNLMYDISSDICDDANLNFDILRPLIKETAAKVQNHFPKDVQTGPAKRNDGQVIESHKKFLYDYPDYQEIYDLLTYEIQQKHEEL